MTSCQAERLAAETGGERGEAAANEGQTSC